MPFIFSASITPASVACARAALKILKNEPERIKNLREISQYMRTKLKEAGVEIIEKDAITPIIPIYTYEPERTFLACQMLLERGVYVNPAVTPVVPEHQCLLRTSYTATHTKEQMDECVAKIKEVLDLLPPIGEEVK